MRWVCRANEIPTLSSCSPDLPFDILDADLVACLLIIVEPFALAQIDAHERRARIDSIRFPVALKFISSDLIIKWIGLTSGLKSVNSSPRQSISIKFLAFDGSVCSYAAGAALMVALDSRC